MLSGFLVAARPVSKNRRPLDRNSFQIAADHPVSGPAGAHIDSTWLSAKVTGPVRNHSVPSCQAQPGSDPRRHFGAIGPGKPTPRLSQAWRGRIRPLMSKRQGRSDTAFGITLWIRDPCCSPSADTGTSPNRQDLPTKAPSILPRNPPTGREKLKQYSCKSWQSCWARTRGKHAHSHYIAPLCWQNREGALKYRNFRAQQPNNNFILLKYNHKRKVGAPFSHVRLQAKPTSPCSPCSRESAAILHLYG